MITCKTCGKEIRGNAATEEYNPSSQKYTFVCKKCDKVFKIVEAKVEEERGFLSLIDPRELAY